MPISTNVLKSQPPVVDRNCIDFTWERTQEQALYAFKTRSAGAARASWAKALDIAERHFERGDPRLAASLTNHAFALMRQNYHNEANRYFARAVLAWEESWRWIPWMTPASDPNTVDAVPFDRVTQEAFYDLVEQAKAITETLWRERRLPEAVGDDWADVKPKGMNDVRCLFAAVFLLPTSKAARHRAT